MCVCLDVYESSLAIEHFDMHASSFCGWFYAI